MAHCVMPGRAGDPVYTEINLGARAIDFTVGPTAEIDVAKRNPAMQQIVARFEITYTQFLDEAGRAVQGFPEELRDPATLRALYEVMVRTRAFDKKAIALQRTGQLGTFASSLGQEAIGAGVGAAMRPEDVLLPSYRDYAAQFSRGVTMTEVLLYWGGDERGMDYQGPRRDFPICVPVASHTCHAAGVAFAMKYRGEARVAVAILGDGATSKGDFYEAINVAGVWRLPVVFVVNNNQWAISVSRRAQTAAETLAQKAIAAGIPGEQVDGNDVVAVRDRVGAAVERAREGQGASLVECLSYRLGRPYHRRRREPLPRTRRGRGGGPARPHRAAARLPAACRSLERGRRGRITRTRRGRGGPSRDRLPRLPRPATRVDVRARLREPPPVPGGTAARGGGRNRCLS